MAMYLYHVWVRSLLRRAGVGFQARESVYELYPEFLSVYILLLQNGTCVTPTAQIQISWIFQMPLTSHSKIISRQEAQYGPANQPTPPGLTVPFDLPLQSGIYNKMLITIAGEIKLNANNFTVNFKRGSDIAFHLNPRFNEGGRQVIVRNSMIGNQWGREERELPSFPFVPGKPFELKILCTDTEFKVAVNKSHLLEYKHRIRELNQIRDLSVYGDVTLSSVNVETLQ
uniref:Galectin n=1 Tax=Cyprinus carpio carpio TaxID=630221 RepID=A0A9J7XTP4_CYPCA